MLSAERGKPRASNLHVGRMTQKSIERLRDYLAQLPPQALALLMQEFERAIDRGEDTNVAGVVLEQLRQLARGVDYNAMPRKEDAARLVFRALEPFLVDVGLPTRPGQIHRASLLPISVGTSDSSSPLVPLTFGNEVTLLPPWPE